MTGKKDKILVVEDEVLIAKNIAEILNELGYHVAACVLSGEDAVIYSEKLKPDLVLMDIKLQGKIGGIEAAETIIKNFGIPVIYLTAYSGNRELETENIMGCYPLPVTRYPLLGNQLSILFE